MKNEIIETKEIKERITSLKLELKEGKRLIIEVYAPTGNNLKEEIAKFYKSLSEVEEEHRVP